MTPHATIDPTGYGADSSCSLPKNSHGDPDQQVLPSVTGSDLIEPVAVVGLSFKLPRDASSVDSFWNILMEQRSTATRFPKDRLSDSAVYHPDPNRRGAVSTRKFEPLSMLFRNNAFTNKHRYHFAAGILSIATLPRLIVHSSLFQILKQLL